jgi:uncharacterized membrane protein YfhO
MADRTDRLKRLGDSDFKPGNVTILEEEPDIPSVNLLAEQGTVQIRDSSAGFYGMTVDTPVSALLVLSETWYPGWQAFVDDAETRIFRANHLIQSIVIPKGKHKVAFCYRSQFLLPGLVLSGLTLCVLALLCWRERCQNLTDK